MGCGVVRNTTMYHDHDSAVTACRRGLPGVWEVERYFVLVRGPSQASKEARKRRKRAQFSGSVRKASRANGRCYANGLPGPGREPVCRQTARMAPGDDGNGGGLSVWLAAMY